MSTSLVSFDWVLSSLFCPPQTCEHRRAVRFSSGSRVGPPWRRKTAKSAACHVDLVSSLMCLEKVSLTAAMLHFSSRHTCSLFVYKILYSLCVCHACECIDLSGAHYVPKIRHSPNDCKQRWMGRIKLANRWGLLALNGDLPEFSRVR